MFHAVNKKFLQIWSSEIIRTFFVTVAANINSISIGLTQGYSSVLLPQLFTEDSPVNITSEEASWIAGLGVLSTPFGALLSGFLVDIMGRRSAIIVTSVPFFIGWVTTAFATDVTLLYVGRAVGGLAAGMAASSYLYVIEVASKEHRSVLSALGPVATSLGVLIIYTVGFLATWEKAALVSSSISILSILLMLKVPESPSWCVSKNQIDRAHKSLKWLRRDSKVAEVELYTLMKSNKETEETKEVEVPKKRISIAKLKDYFNAAKSPAVYKPFFILIFFFIFQIGSGIYVLLFYLTQIFHQFGTNYDENLITVSAGVFRFIMSILGTYLMAKVGRRALGMASGILMSLSMLLICLYTLVPALSSYQFLVLVSVLFHVGFSMIGFVQIPWILTCELFPLNCRGFLSGLIYSLAYFIIFIAVKIYTNLLDILGPEGLFWGFFVMSSVGTLFIYFFVPETKDKALKDISNAFLKNETTGISIGKITKTFSKDIFVISTNNNNNISSNNNNYSNIQKDVTSLEVVLYVPKKCEL